MAPLTRVVVAVVLAGAAEARAQGHDPAPAAKPHAAPAAAHEDPHPGTPPAEGRKVPTVSRAAAPPPRVTSAVSSLHGAPEGHAPAAQTGGYVATGARPKAAEGGAHGATRPRPVVSGGAIRTAPAAAASKPDPHVAPAAAAGHETPAADGHASEPAHGRPVAPGAVPTRDVAPRPVRLADVHTRLAAALADARVPTVRESGGALVAHEGLLGAGAAVSRSHRVVLKWPGPRWQVAWPAPGRVTVRWPQPAAAPDAAAATAVPQH